MKIFFDIFPVVLFFATYSLSKDIFLATKVAMIVSGSQLIYTLARYRKIPAMLGVSTILIIVLGGATLYFKNKHFIMWKPSLLFWSMAIGLLISALVKKNGLRIMLGKQLTLPSKIWMRGNIACVMFLVILGILNLYIAYNFSESTWVNFKMFGIFGLNLAFLISLFLYLSRFDTKKTEEN